MFPGLGAGLAWLVSHRPTFSQIGVYGAPNTTITSSKILASSPLTDPQASATPTTLQSPTLPQVPTHRPTLMTTLTLSPTLPPTPTPTLPLAGGEGGRGTLLLAVDQASLDLSKHFNNFIYVKTVLQMGKGTTMMVLTITLQWNNKDFKN